MAEPLMIEGWDCRIVRGQRSAAHEHGSATVLPNGFLVVMKAIGDEEECTANTVPPAVLAFLIRPLLEKAWDEGWNAEPMGDGNPKPPNPYAATKEKP